MRKRAILLSVEHRFVSVILFFKVFFVWPQVDWCFSDDDLDKLILKEDPLVVELHESESTNQSLLLDNIHKVEGIFLFDYF